MFQREVGIMKITNEMKKHMTKKQLRERARLGRCPAYQGRDLGTLDMKSARQYDRAVIKKQLKRVMEEIG